MGSRKDKISVDILFDDAMHNVMRSNARYPILMRRPWNAAATGMMAVNTYDEFLKFVEVISDSYNVNQKRYSLDEPSIVVLVGPSGSGKSKIASKFLAKTDRFEKLMSYTTNDPTAVESNDWYNYVGLEEFREMCESGELFQSTMYAGHAYGSKKSDVEAILAKGKHVMTTMDICGAMSLKTNFPNVTTIYIQRDRKDLLKTILRKNSSMEDKIDRIIAVEPESKNADICDYVIEFDRYDDAVRQLRNILGV
jgi:guanylate kinase